ncbi:MAG: YegS/Rv2252/BmrU family lipid kinase [Syntrophomonadaceae bacterium]|nr:YegS/Rv2252/BmrU family lipid kinase [Syntrophomonadaceae bacterium]
MKRKIGLFYNPVAGGGRFKDKLDPVIQYFQEAGFQVIPWRIRDNEMIVEQLKGNDPGKYHTIIAAGGDGTINGVVNAMMEYEFTVPLGIFPEGTSNDVANYLRIPCRVDEYCRVITEGSLIDIDLGEVNSKYFINVASAGQLTQTAHEVNYHLKNKWGKLAYYLKAMEKLPKLQSSELRLTVDGGQTYFMEVLLFLILNGGTAGGFQQIMPEGKMSDGVLDFLAIKAAPIPRLPRLMYHFTRGQHLQDKQVFYCQGKQFRLELEPRLITDLDGEKGPDLPWNVQVHPKALKIRV